MQVQSVEWSTDDHFSHVRALIDGKEAVIVHEQNAPRVGYVLLFPTDVWKDILPDVTIPEDTGLNRPELVFQGATNQVDIVRLWWDMHEALALDQFDPGPRPVTQAKLTKAYAVRKSALPLQMTIASQSRLAELLNMAMLQTALSISDEEVRELYSLKEKTKPAILDKLCLPDIETELVSVLSDMYSESRLIVWTRIFEAARKMRIVPAHQAVPPLMIEMQPDEPVLHERAKLIMQRMDYGTIQFIGHILAGSDKWNSELTTQVQQTLVVGDGSGIAAERLKNVVATETTWCLERFAHDLLELNGVKQKTWQLFPDNTLRCSVCAANKEFEAPLGFLYESEMDEGILHPPGSVGCQCQLLPSYTDLSQLVKTLLIKADSQTEFEVSLALSDEAATLIGGVDSRWVRVGKIPPMSVGDLQSSVRLIGQFVPSAQLMFTGETGQEADKDVAYVDVPLPWIAMLKGALQSVGVAFEAYPQFWAICGPAGTTQVELTMQFGSSWPVSRVHFSWIDAATGDTQAVQITTQK